MSKKKSKPKTGSIEWREEIKKKSGNAYRKWTESEERLLMKRVAAGWTIRRMAEAHGRRTGGISSRIEKLELESEGLVGPSIRKSRTRKIRRKRRMSNEASEEMKRRTESGEFGTPPDLQLVNDAWADVLEKEMQRVGKNGNYNSITGLWPRNGTKVAFDGRVQDEVTIPAGSKVLCFYGNPEPGTRQPEFRLVYVTYDDE